ncbi:MAG: response regulator transcription factor [Candidatus Limnocylindrales bacterium]
MILRVLLADDHAVVRDGTRQFIDADPDFTVVGEAGDGATIVDLAARIPCDVVLMDLGLPVLNGIEATRRIRATGRGPRVLVLSAYDDEDYVAAAIDAGASGYLPKSAHAAEVIAAIRAVASGQMVLHPDIGRNLFRRKGASDDRRDELTPRELEVLRLAAAGARTRDIAAQLSVSPRTVEAAFTSIFNRLGVMTRTEAVLYGVSRGWIRLERERPLDGG